MAYNNPTTNYTWTLPTEDGSTDDWGRILNEVFGNATTGVDTKLAAALALATAAMPQAGGTFTADVTFATGARLLETEQAMSALEIDWAAGNFFQKTLASGNSELTFANLPANPSVQFITLNLRQPAGGDGTISFASTVFWQDDTAPTLSTTGGDHDIITFMCYNGTVVVGAHALTALNCTS